MAMRDPEPQAYTTPHDWTITGDQPPAHLWPVIRDAYIVPLQSNWYMSGIGWVPSMRSVYRPVEYEISKGRSGRSLHCFPAGTQGAADLTTHDGSSVMDHVDNLVEELPFRRLCVYRANNFVHVDYGDIGRRSGDRRSLWVCDGPNLPWVRMSWLAEIG